MRKFGLWFWLLLMLIGLSGCPKAFKGNEANLPAGVAIGDHFYTQYSFQYEKNRHRTTNYRRGLLVPINTEVELVSWGRKGFQIRVLPSGPVIQIENVQKHTGDTVEQAFHKMLARRPVNLRRFTPRERKLIKAGKVAVGMRKQAVIAAIGYPPVAATPTLDLDEWRYWSSRFDTFIVRFRNGKVVAIIN
ncbi:hypothetical protein MIN45_P2266 [Methylomarinovum tepidoasis]|uniref:Lipoprotein n=1 Tax=Methylomarinovum tepidoasis TaxID=2840183 RepID=A0AAU9C889_9GAMM|nr:hypothetical protein [Methylomarinovum sp. IN45]BCX89892.1 hypothetical protein MIN45_P2266 [Methylomarinovum sp. IN45]